MNRICRNYNLEETFFLNPHGLSNKINKSNCYDLSKISELITQDKFL